jgi:hypothetical protein
MTQKEYNENKAYIEDWNVSVCGKAWDDKPFSAELECFTSAGGDMIVCLEVLDKEHLQEYIDNFDINDEVLMWWQDGGKRVPFSNIRDHYDDLEDWVEGLQEICDGMPH